MEVVFSDGSVHPMPPMRIVVACGDRHYLLARGGSLASYDGECDAEGNLLRAGE